MPKVSIQALGEAGWLPDQTGFEMAPNAITDLQNFRFVTGWAEKAGGYMAAFDTPLAAPYFLTPFATAANRFIVHCTASSVYADVPGTRTDITGPALTSVTSNAWTGGVLSGILAINNGTDAPMYWSGDTATDLAVLPAWDATHRARSVRPYKYHLVATNVTKAGVNYPHRVKWSAAAEPGSVPASWDETDPTNDAGEVDVLGDGVLVDSAVLGESLVLYKQRSMALMTYVGGDEVFSIQPLPDPIGMLAPGCVAVVPGVGHVVLTQGDVMRHAGQGAVSILDGKAKAWLQANMSPDNFAKSFVVASYRKSEVWVCFPRVGSSVCDLALVWNWTSNTLSKRDLPGVTYGCAGSFDYVADTFDNDAATFDSESLLIFDDTGANTVAGNDTQLLTCSSAGIYAMDFTTQNAGVDFTGTIERTGLHFDQPERRKHLKRIWPRIDAAPGVQISVYFGASSDIETAPTYQAPVTFTVGTDQWADAWAEGRFLAYKLSSTSHFRVRSIDLDVAPGGEF